MTTEKRSLAERAADREAAQALRREQVKGLWLSVKDDDPFADHHYRRMFAMEILLNDAELKPHVGSFLGQSAVDRNAYSQKQKDYLSRLIEEYLKIAPPAEPKSKKKTEAGK